MAGKRQQISAASTRRTQLINICDAWYGRVAQRDSTLADSIVNKHNASADDSGPEGFFATMSDKDIELAAKELAQTQASEEFSITLRVKMEKYDPLGEGEFEFNVDTNDVGELVLTPYDKNIHFVSGELE